MKTVGIVFGVIFGLLFLVALAIGGRELGWWLRTDNTNRQVKIDNLNTGTQTAWHDQAIQDVKNFYLLDEANSAQHGMLRNEACQYIARLSDPYLDDILVEFQAQEC